MPIQTPYKRCVMILADGSRPDVLEGELKKGNLPYIARYLVEPGSLLHGVSVFPSTTGPAYLPYLTGCYPGTCNLPGIRWFDKKVFSQGGFSFHKYRSYVGVESIYMNRDLRPEIKTLFELIPNSQNIFSAINRGVSFAGNKTKYSRIWHWYYAHLTDRWGGIDVAAGEKLKSALKEKPEFTFVVFPGVDEFSHLASPFHPKAIQAYQTLDRSIGELVKSLQQMGMLEETLFFIVSDHGLSETKVHLPLNQFLEKLGIETFYYPRILGRGEFNAANMVSGNAMSHLYFRDPTSNKKWRESWNGRSPWESLIRRPDQVVDRLLEREEVDLLMAERLDGSIMIKSRRGEATVKEIDSKQFEYRILTQDPFGYVGFPQKLTSRESLEWSDKTEYPDALAQIVQLFRSKRTGDLVVSASKGHDLRLNYEIHEHKGSHGSLHWEHMKVPIVSNYKLPQKAMRSVDVFPWVLKLLGHQLPPYQIDGDTPLTLF